MSFRNPSINSVSISGNIVRDAEINHVGDANTPVTTITVAHNQRYKAKDGKWQETVSFIDVEVWGPLAEREDYYKKGVPVIVEGILKGNQWKDKEGKSHSKVIVRASKVHVLVYPDKESKEDK
ncbi:MAG: single-stranded DNA-binding protein [Candidatus Cloacimonetes bacterium]|nr:single-stranded DNA-binding protein [Candidatus Cloacimonadota bacterium]